MTFVDAITVQAVEDTAEGRLFVDPCAEYLRDHFPTDPMLPGLLMLESAVRTAAALWSAREPQHVGAGTVLDRVERLQVVRRVVAGETLVVRAQLIAQRCGPDTAVFKAVGAVEGETAIRARFRLRTLQPGEHHWPSARGGDDDDAR